MDERANEQHGRRAPRRWRRSVAAVAVAVGCLGAFPTEPADAQDYVPVLRGCGATLTRPSDMAMPGPYRFTPPSWECQVADHFNGTSLNSNLWAVQTTAGSGFGVAGECFVDDPDNISVSAGTLKLTARKEAAPITCGTRTSQYTAGSIFTKEVADQTYGRFEIRARMPATNIDSDPENDPVPGLHFAFWLWPRDLAAYPAVAGPYGGWSNGELDIMEWYSVNNQLGVPFIHYAHTMVDVPNGSGGTKSVPNDPNITSWGPNCYVGNANDWHTYTLEWSPRAIRMLYDGKVCLQNTSWTPRNTTMPGPFNKDVMTSLTQTFGALGSANQLTAATPTSATAEVDYLMIWR